jgi:hypothetical protein
MSCSALKIDLQWTIWHYIPKPVLWEPQILHYRTTITKVFLEKCWCLFLICCQVSCVSLHYSLYGIKVADSTKHQTLMQCHLVPKEVTLELLVLVTNYSVGYLHYMDYLLLVTIQVSIKVHFAKKWSYSSVVRSLFMVKPLQTHRHEAQKIRVHFLKKVLYYHKLKLWMGQLCSKFIDCWLSWINNKKCKERWHFYKWTASNTNHKTDIQFIFSKQ